MHSVTDRRTDRRTDGQLAAANSRSYCVAVRSAKNYCFKHPCNDDNDIGRRKQQKLDYHIFTCKFPISYITMSADNEKKTCL